MPAPRTVAVILAGAVAQGAFEAGALKVLAECGIRVARIVAASSGALNGAYYAAAVRRRREREAVGQLIDLWQDHASWHDVFHVDLGDLVHGRGMSDGTRLLGILRDNIPVVRVDDPADVDLVIVVAPLAGVSGQIGDTPATTYEAALEFTGADFDTKDGLDKVFNAAVASSSFPLLFVPTMVPGLGPCVDGGAVNNTPIKYALGGTGSSVDAIVVISPTAAHAPGVPVDLHGVGLIGHLTEMLINERLYRDLRDHDARNAALAALAGLGPEVIDADRRAAIQRALGWEAQQVVQVVQIRPTDRLPGSAFSGFDRADLRAEYVEIGAERALEVLRGLGWC